MDPKKLIAGLFSGFAARLEHAHANAPKPGEIPAPTEAAEPHQLRIGAWFGRSVLDSAERDLTQAMALGIVDAHFIVNDHSAKRAEIPFDIYPREQLIAAAEVARGLGMRVHLMSWLMPHEAYLTQAASTLALLARHTGAASIVLDLEEPWTLAKRGMGWQAAAEHFADRWAVECSRDGELARWLRPPPALGVTGIRYASKRKLGPIIEALDAFLVPQCYATSSSKADPSTVVSKGVGQWGKLFGEDRRIVAGLAAYRQTGIKGHTPGSAILAAIDDADDHTNEVIFWWGPAIASSAKVQRAIRSVTLPLEVA